VRPSKVLQNRGAENQLRYLQEAAQEAAVEVMGRLVARAVVEADNQEMEQCQMTDATPMLQLVQPANHLENKPSLHPAAGEREGAVVEVEEPRSRVLKQVAKVANGMLSPTLKKPRRVLLGGLHMQLGPVELAMPPGMTVGKETIRSGGEMTKHGARARHGGGLELLLVRVLPKAEVVEAGALEEGARRAMKKVAEAKEVRRSCNRNLHYHHQPSLMQPR